MTEKRHLDNAEPPEGIRAMDRRSVFAGIAALATGAGWPRSVSATEDPRAGWEEPRRTKDAGHLRKVATEEAFTIPEVAEAVRGVVREGGQSLDLKLLALIFDTPPETSSKDGAGAPFRDYRMEGAIWGYGVEAGTHAVRLMLSGVLDRFPRLRIILGHMGEALPFWLWRLDFMASPGSRAALKNQLKPSEYFRRNFAITTSGLEDPLALRFCIDKIGIDSIMWAIDYPYQPSAPAVAFLESAPLTDQERAQVAHRNAERIFGI